MKSKKATIRVAVAGLIYAAFIQQATAEHILYTEKLPAQGTVHTKSETMGMNNCVISVEMGEQKMNGSMTRNGEKIQVTTFDNETQITIEVKKETSKGSVTMMGQKQPDKVVNEPLHGNTVILTKSEGKWTGKLKEGKATEEQQKKINEFTDRYNGDNNAAHIYGTKPRSVGESWDVDASELSDFGVNSEKLEGKFKITFKAIEDVQGEKCAVLLADVDVKGPTDENDGILQMKAKVRILRSLKHLVDIESKIEGDMIMNGKLNNGAGTMKMTGPVSTLTKIAVKVP